MKKRTEGYMTVEASLVMSSVLLIYVFILRYALWCYDRCMLDLDVAAILLRCAGVQETELVWQQEKREWDKDKYLWLQSREIHLESGILKHKISGSGEGGSMGKTRITYEMWDMNPQEWLRGKRKVESGQSQKKGEEGT